MITSARVDIEIVDNGTWQDAFIFGTAGDTTWSFTGQSFRMDIKGAKDDTTVKFSLTSVAGQIVVADAVQRILHFNVPDTDVQTSLPDSEYVYDLIMFDASTPPVRVPLMHGEITVKHGVTGD